jgi:uncharacterized protein
MKINNQESNAEVKNLQVEIKELKEDGSFEGYVAVFNNVDFGDDIFSPKAFAEETPNKYYPILADHDTRKVIGKLQVYADDYGLKLINAKLNLMTNPKTNDYLVPLAAEKYANLKNGDISGLSVGYRVRDCEFKEVDGTDCRVITRASLMEGSIVTFPMNILAGVSQVKSLDEITCLKDIESLLKIADFSSKEAKTIISKVKEISKQRDVEEKQALREVEEIDNALKALKNLTTFINQNNQ